LWSWQGLVMVVLLELLPRWWKERTCIIMHWSSFLSSLIALMIVLDGVSSKAVIVPFLRGLLLVLLLLFLVLCLFCFRRWLCFLSVLIILQRKQLSWDSSTILQCWELLCSFQLLYSAT
jgi:hypothetical protein